MADEADRAVQAHEDAVAIGIAQARAAMPAGEAGVCDGCGHEMKRLVGGLCGFCRDGRQPPDDWEPPAIDAGERERIMARTINLPASEADAMKLVEARAAEHNLGLGTAAAQLIRWGAEALDRDVPGDPAAASVQLTLDDLLDQVRERFAAQEQASVDIAIADATARAAEAERLRKAADARAGAAEQALADLKARIGALAG